MGPRDFMKLPQEGEAYGKYQLLEKVAVGGMAEVFKALSISIGGFQKLVALKRILPHLSTDAEFVSLFIDEAKLTVSLNHGNIVQVIDFGRIENNYYLAMELVDGRDMTQVLIKQSRARRTVPLEVAFYITSETLRGLEYAHSRRGRDGEALGIVHRDVSPHNILVSYDGEVKITDFGIAKARTKVSLTRPGVVLGKFAYMSPEQARGKDVDARSDVYSAGITLYETLTGRRLFYSEDPAAILAKVRSPKVPPPSRYAPNIPPEVDQMVMKALAIEPDERFQSARELATALETRLQDLAPGFNDSHLARFMKGLFEDEVGPERFSMAASRDIELATERIPSHRPRAAMSSKGKSDGSLGDPVLVALKEKVLDEPNLWTLVEMGEHLIRLGRPQDAQRCLRVAGMKFAQNGLLVQSVAIYVRVKDLEGWSARLAVEVEGIRALPGLPNSEVLARLGGLGDDELSAFLTQVVAFQGPSTTSITLTSPLFSFLDSAEFSNLVNLLELKRVAPSTTIMREGDKGDGFCIIARGRVLVYCYNFHGDKVYLSSLSDGDCFGEFSFFTGEPRAATAEALEDVLLFEVRQRDFDTILDRFPNLTQALLQFYKSRVVGTLLAKSEVFGGLSTETRSALVDKLKLEHWTSGQVVLREREQSDGFYLIKSGEVEVYSERSSGYVFLNKLRSGEFFGEIAAVTGQPRSASVRALGPCELLRLSGEDLQELLETHPAVKEILLGHVARREAETARRLTAGGMLI
ncbi:MAG: cyclic nucleotide-binding domain-containing protein [Myxococcales bacterium]|nr:cyclic nucleotide-binding domain-containing protein [Myxococcales bacterium]MCB9652162.1 cyclic nucleotide-binding domain-containing protein [Deltaproteobacteria bacterium]